MTTRLQAATEKLRQRIDGRYEARRQAATATVTDVARDTKTGHTTGTVTATIDGVSNQRVFVGAGTGVRVGDNLRVENRGSGVAPEWIMLGKDGSPAGAEGVVDVERLLSTPGGLSLASDAYAATNGAGILANVTAQWTQTPDWEAPAYYEVSYYRYADGAAKAHVSRAPHTNGAATAQISILNLLPGTEYVLAVRVVGYGGGLSAWTAEQSIVTATDASAPATPTGLAAAEVTSTSLRFTWSRSAEADFWYYEIGVSTSAGTGGMLAGYPRSAGDTPEHVATVTPLTNYYFRVRALDTSGNASAWSGWSGPHATAKAPVDVIDVATLIDTDFGLGIKASGKIGIDLASPSGLSFLAGDLRIDDSIAGAGLGISAKVLNVGAGNGISVAADSVAVNQAYAFNWTANHSWTGNLQHPDYASQVSNWRIASTGAADFRYLYADELHVKSFIADLEQALAGGQIISKSVAVLSRDFTAPAAGAATTLYVWDLPSAENMAVFQSGDIVRIRSFSRAGGSLSVADCWGVVTSYSNLAGKEQSWTFTRSAAPNAGAMNAEDVVQADALVLDYGTTGNGFHEVNAIDGTYAANSPYSQIVTWSSHPATGQTVRTRTGNLTGLAFPSQPANEYGFYAGDGRDVDDKYIRISTWGAELHNLPLNLYTSGTAVVSINPNHPSTGGPSIGVGTNANNLTYHANTGIFAGWDNTLSAYVMKIGNDDQYLKWNGSELEVSGIIRVVDGGDFLPITYRPVQVNFTHLSVASSTTETITFARSGYLNTYDGHRYYFSTTIPNEIRITIDKGYRDVVAYVFKDGHNIHRVPYGGGEPLFCNGIDNALPNGELPPLIDVNFERTDRYFDNAYYSQADRNNHVIVATVRLSSDYLRVDGVFARGESPSTTIGPGYIVTDSLSAISANLGSITSGKMWITAASDADPRLAIGGASATAAPFRVYETGRTIIGDGTSYIEWNSPNLIVKGNIQADAGSINALSVTGQLSWNSGHSYINNSIIRVSDSGTTSLLRIGDATENYHGLINIDMAQGPGTGWGYGIRIADGGNTSTQVQALFDGDSAVDYDAAVDRIFLARTANRSYADGFYAQMGIGGFSGFINAGLNSVSYWDSKGAGVKIDHSGTAPGMLINIKNSGSHQPAIWATAHQDSATAMLYALLTGPGQTGLEVNRVNNNGVAVKTNGAPIQMGWGDITGIGRMIFRSGGGITGTTNLGTPRFDAWIEVWIEGNSNNYYIPLTAFGTH